ncbi:MAG: hypothetical protein OEX02_18210 [Cyclobacteriaceae bacterium]|nr:hypothetical protein [Cyclobacteriaceae bacterium]
MRHALNFNRILLIFGTPLALLGVLVFLMNSSLLNATPFMGPAITIDLLLSVPLVYYFLIRKSNIPKTTVIPVMIAGLLLGSYFLPKESQTYLSLFKTWALPTLEMAVFIYIVIQVRGAIKKYKAVNVQSTDFYTVLKQTCRAVFPKQAAMLFATELAIIYYGLFSWRSRPVRENEYTYHKESGSLTLYITIVFLIAVETFVVHLLVMRWSTTAAWVFTGLSIYTIIQVLAILKSLAVRPLVVDNDTLVLRYGFLNETEIPIEEIEQIEISSRELKKHLSTRTLSPLGDLESHNLIITMKQEKELVGMYGIKKKFKVLSLYVDKPEDFKRDIKGEKGE